MAVTPNGYPTRRPGIARIAALTLLAAGGFAGAAAQQLAFPGAEGFGRFAQGGRGGEVYHVTHLDDGGPGSFRDAVSKPNRTVVFQVGGIIRIAARVTVSPNVHIAGQTAPGDGITVYGNGVSYSGANHSITRYIRYRMGVIGEEGKDGIGIADGHDMIFDHVSSSWGRDETFSINGEVGNVTIQDCIIAQGLQTHSCGGLMQSTGGVSILRTLYIDNHTRNPKVKGINQFVNNVIYNWQVAAYILGDSEQQSYATVIGNYFIDGPESDEEAFSRGNLNFHIHAVDNFQDANRNGKLDGAVLPQAKYGTVDWRTQPHAHPAVTTLTPEKAFAHVLAQAGASLKRDEVDALLMDELTSFGTRGRTIKSETENTPAGPGQVRGGTPPADGDKDGMADTWESQHGLNPKDAKDGNADADGNGYTNLEDYLNGLVQSPGQVGLIGTDPVPGRLRGQAAESPGSGRRVDVQGRKLPSGGRPGRRGIALAR
jgi:hypothetical protein